MARKLTKLAKFMLVLTNTSDVAKKSRIFVNRILKVRQTSNRPYPPPGGKELRETSNQINTVFSTNFKVVG